jgi:hypothetical protein
MTSRAATRVARNIAAQRIRQGVFSWPRSLAESGRCLNRVRKTLENVVEEDKNSPQALKRAIVWERPSGTRKLVPFPVRNRGRARPE